MHSILLVVGMFCSLLAPARASVTSEQSTTTLEQRSKAVARLVAEHPEWSDDLFDASFLKAVPPERLRKLCTDMFEKYGEVKTLTLQKQESELAGKYEALLAKGFSMQVTIGLTKAEPHSIVSLWFGPPAPILFDLEAVAGEFGKLPGSVSFAVCKLGDKELVSIAEHDGDRALAIGSSFKLYVLGALVRAIAQDQRHLADTVTLRERWMSLPSGKLHKWPAGVPLTLCSLAALMISESDNTATDHLLFTLGRDAVEAQLAAMGNGNAERNLPFLSTGELFRLKLVGGGHACEEYLALETAGKREYLEHQVAALTLDEQNLDSAGLDRPQAIDTIEWFASARDLCRALDWLRRETEPEKCRLLRSLLSINRGLDISEDSFPYVGFKGGSETGVIELAYLLRSKAGDWYALAAGWNDPKAAVDELRFSGLVTRAIHVLASQIEKTETR